MKTAIVTPDTIGPVRNGGIGTFCYNFARLLRQHGHDVVLIFTGPLETPQAEWMHLYTDHGIAFIQVQEARTAVHGPLYEWFMRRSEAVAAVMPDDVEVVYFQDWQANGFHLTRQRRYQTRRHPAVVTVLHSNTEWIRDGMEQFHRGGYFALSIAFAERYVAQHSDFVAAPSQHMVDWVRDFGWKLPERVHVLGYPILPETLPQVDEAATYHDQFKHLIFFGRLETRKGLEVFIEAVRQLGDEHPALFDSIESIVLLGKLGQHRYTSLDSLAMVKPLERKTTLSQPEAMAYLAARRGDSLVVIPSRSDNYPFTVIETALIPGLNVIRSSAGGIPEIVPGAQFVFDPEVRPLKAKLREMLQHGPYTDPPAYDYERHNRLWLDFHEQVCEFARTGASTPLAPVPSPAVNICVPYYNLPQYLPQLLRSLAIQTTQDFTVTVVNDGSTDARAVEVFEAMREQYPAWQFVSKENGGVGHTRNYAAHLGDAPYIIFMDADNVAAPNMVERFLGAIRASGDDCLTCYMAAFEGDDLPYQYTDGKLTDEAEIAYVYTPLGNAPAAGIFDNPFGDANFIIRRGVFEALGGFREDRYTSFEDREFLTLLSLNGYALDVVPEYLFYYRHREAGFSRVTSRYRNEMRVQRVYREKLKDVGLENLSPLLASTDSFRFDPPWIAGYVPVKIIVRAVMLKALYRTQRTLGSRMPAALKRWMARLER